MMYALSLLRPWGNAIIRYGKDIENRVWAPSTALQVGDRFAIHNAKRIDDAGVTRVMSILKGSRPAFSMDAQELLGEPGLIVGTVRFCGIVRGSTNMWFDGPIGWVLSDPRPAPERIVCLGQQRLWALPPGIEEMLRGSL